MTTIFLSHSSKDKFEARELKEWLEAEERGHFVFLDDDLHTGIKSGEDWEKALYQQLRECRVFLPIFTQNWLDSKWCFAEMTHARASGKLILPVKINTAFDTSSLFSNIQQTPIDLSLADQIGYQRLDRAMREEFPWSDPQRSPYPGLSAFKEDEGAIFKGRDPEITNAIEVLEGLRRRGPKAAHFVLLLGASGSGKSSLVRAGIIPRLKPKSDWLYLAPFMPRKNPIDELSEVLSKAFKNGGAQYTTKIINTTLSEAADVIPPDGKVLVDLIRDLRIERQSQNNATLLLVIDQAEELFSISGQHQSDKFLGLLRAAIELSDGRVMVLATMRSEFLGTFQSQPFLIDPHYTKPLVYEDIPLDPLPTERFHDIICGPAELTGLLIDGDLVECMITDTGTRDALPLLAYTLRRMWDNEDYRADGRFEIREYRELGKLEGSISKAADEALDIKNLSAGELETIRGAFVPNMVRLAPEGAPVRQRIRSKALPVDAYSALEPFIENRLLITDTDSEGNETIEVAHEALLRSWTKLVDWLNEDRDKLILLEGANRAAKEWLNSENKPDLLVHRGDRLGELVKLVRETRFKLQKGSGVAKYLRACVKSQQKRDLKQQEGIKQKIRDAEKINEANEKTILVFKRSLAIVAVFLLLMIGATFFAFYQKKIADERFSQTKASLLWNNLVFNNENTSLESETLWELATADQLVKNAFLEQLLDSKELSRRFALKPRLITRAIVGVDSKYRESIIESYIDLKTTKIEQTAVSLGKAMLAIELEAVKGNEDILIDAIKTIKNYKFRQIISDKLVQATRKLPPSETMSFVKKLLSNIQGIKKDEREHGNDPVAELNKSLAVAAGMLSSTEILSIISVIEKNIKKPATDSDIESILRKEVNVAESIASILIKDKAVYLRAWNENKHMSSVFFDSIAVIDDKFTYPQALKTFNMFEKIISNDSESKCYILANVASKLKVTHAIKVIDQFMHTSLSNNRCRNALHSLVKEPILIHDSYTDKQAAIIVKFLLSNIHASEKDIVKKDLVEVGEVLVQVSGKLNNNQAQLLIDDLVQHATLGNTRNPNDIYDIGYWLDYRDLLVFYGKSLAAIQGDLSETQADSITESLELAMKGSGRNRRLEGVREFIYLIVDKLSSDQSKKLSKAFLKTMPFLDKKDVFYDSQIAVMSVILAFIPKDITSEYVEIFTKAIIKALPNLNFIIADTTAPEHKYLASIIAKLTNDQVTEVIDALIEVILNPNKTEDSQRSQASNVLNMLINSLMDSQRHSVAKLLLDAIGNKENVHSWRLMPSFKSVSKKLTNEFFADDLISALEQSKSHSMRMKIAEALVIISGRLTENNSNRIAKVLVETFTVTNHKLLVLLGKLGSFNNTERKTLTNMLVQMIEDINNQLFIPPFKDIDSLRQALADPNRLGIFERSSKQSQLLALNKGLMILLDKNKSIKNALALRTSKALEQAIIQGKETEELGKSLTVILSKLEKDQVNSIVIRILKYIKNNPKKVNQLDTFSRVLVTSPVILTQPQSLIEMLMIGLNRTTILKDLAKILNMGSIDLTEHQASLVIKAIVPNTQNNYYGSNYEVLRLQEGVITALSILTDNQLDELAKELLLFIKRNNFSQKVLINSLTKVGPKLSAPQVKKVAESLVKEIAITKEQNTINTLNQALLIAIDKIPDKVFAIEMVLEALKNPNIELEKENNLLKKALSPRLTMSTAGKESLWYLVNKANKDFPRLN